MNLKKISITNFLSIKDMELNLEDYKGLILIDGINKDLGGSNGSGKSSIIEAITWCLFGKSLRGAVGKEFIHNGEKSCKISVEFDDGLCVARSRHPSQLMVFRKDEVFTQEKISETQSTLEELLGISYKVFLSTICIGQHNAIRFFELTADGKREVIRNFLNLPELDGLRSLIASKKSKLKIDLNNNSLEKTLLKLKSSIERKATKIYKRTGFLKIVNHAIDEEIRNIDRNKQFLLEEQSHLKFWEKSLSEKGHIRNIVGKILHPLNLKIDYWTKQCFPELEIKITHELTEELLVSGKTIAYNSLSGGERRLVNVCLLLALADFVVESYAIPFDFIFLDEVAENLDDSKVKKLHKLLEKYSRQKKVFLITHNRDLKKKLQNNKIMLKKENGVTTIEN